ncbi:MAG: hypothetical protein HY059_01545 [Proteobacteria bacterium]|nr:hypothetical protein [Pseudomonadota bacterium]
MFRNKNDGFKIGDRFVAIGRESIFWEIELVFQDPNKIPHARLRRLDNASIQRTFSFAALMNPEMFRRSEAAVTGA